MLERTFVVIRDFGARQVGEWCHDLIKTLKTSIGWMDGVGIGLKEETVCTAQPNAEKF